MRIQSFVCAAAALSCSVTLMHREACAQEPSAATTPAATTPAATSTVAAAEEPAVGETKSKNLKKKKDKKNRNKKSKFKPKGRLLMASELSRQNYLVVNSAGTPENVPTTALDLIMQSARAGFEYRSPLPWLSAELEVEFAGKVQLKDAYAQAEQKFWDVKAGQFKMPISALAMESVWNLPIVHRGFIDDILFDRLDIGGRRPGVTASVGSPSGVKPRFTVGAFQGSELVTEASDNRNTDLIERQGMSAQSLVARGQLKLNTVKLGASYEHRLGAPAVGKTRHYWTTGLDLKWDEKYSASGLRLWADVLSGASWYEHPGKPPDDSDAVFVALRALAAYRFGGVHKGDLYLEPFLQAALHEPDTDVVDDFAVEMMFGLGFGFWDRARLTVQGEVVKAEHNFPDRYTVGVDPDRVALMLQGGVAF